MRFLSLLFALIIIPLSPAAPVQPAQVDDAPPVLQNPGFEWSDGYHEQPSIRGLVPNGWHAKILDGDPLMSSTDHWAKEGCGPNAFVERLEGEDSLVVLAAPTRCGQGFVAPPFDAALYQSVNVSAGQEYSLSAWMVSLCGGSGNPNPCPTGAYIAKMAGLDPAGGTDPVGPTVQWTEDLRPHIEARWVNLIDATTAQTSTLTVFIRVRSPFRFEGNHAFADAVKLVRAPQSVFAPLSISEHGIAVSWTGSLGPDIPAIPASNHKLSFELQVRRNGGEWVEWLSGQGAGGAVFPGSGGCTGNTYQFRIRAWAIQPAGVPGAWPNHRFVGTWHQSEVIPIDKTSDCSPRSYLPMATR